MRKANSVAKVAITAGLAFGLIAAGASTAQADPSASGRTYQMAGSDTIQGVGNGLTNGYTVGSTTVSAFAPNIGSWDAFGSATITPKTGSMFTRPAGSGDGVKALSASWNTAAGKDTWTDANGVVSPSLQPSGTHALDFARSSSKPSTPVNPGLSTDKLTWVPLARDAVSVAFQSAGVSGISISNLDTADLTFLYSGTGSRTSTALGGTITRSTVNASDPTDPANDPVITVGSTSVSVHPVLPTQSSGTRTFFIGAIGVTTATTGSWVRQGVQENTATEINASGEIAPFSAAQWIQQKNGVSGTTNTFTGSNASSLNLLSLNTLAPTAGSGSSLTPGALFGDATVVPGTTTDQTLSPVFARDVFTVVPTANYNNDVAVKNRVDSLRSATRSSTSSVKIVADYGFKPLAYTAAGAGVFHANFTN
ncbi:hypothetical protein [Agreia bicolorata]|uniref:Uncharacterized protein n=1 Tax=Agreia bicolorata TaxID=110935 RepID=A0ABR5CD73_9MICO|nr:hypothetical protein [Agreia bicolorata]KJC63584.1 hypothetical protein TZ00_13680 [Agreia bicolorata]